MTRRTGLPRAPLCLLAAATAAVVAAATTLAAPGGQEALPKVATVTGVPEGDVVTVRLEGGARLPVRLLAIDAPRAGECYGPQATAALKRLALGRRATLRGDSPREKRDARGRLLAYLEVGRVDVAKQLLAGGYARVAVQDVGTARLAAYRKAERVAQVAVRGVWACPSGGSETPPGSNP